MTVEAMMAKARVLKGRVQNLIIKFKKRMNWFDISRNLDTSDCVDREFIFNEADSPNVKYMGRYVPTDFLQIKDSLSQLIAFDKSVLEHTFVDFGCGKGRVLIMAERMGFKKLIGVEFSKKLYDICLRNLNKVNSKAAQVVCGDAVEYRLSGDTKTFYFCNPFEYCLFEQILNNIRGFLKTARQDGYIVYIDTRNFGRLDPDEYELLFKYDGPGTPFHIYKVLL
ncbi:MAG: class I SAM-dependent methyltransferase [Candidatus Omnitrophica bacterium]|nr:class I SAM-dependent methyltransferase [Candidatus Omnitrophota bacterium]